jgi:hypothetical protein
MTDCTPITQEVIDGEGDTSQFPIPPPALSPIAINASSGFPLTLQAATAGNLTRLYRLFLVVDGATELTFYDGATALAPVLKCAAGEQLVLDQSLFPWFQGSVNTDFKMDSSNAVQLTGAAWINLNAT